jgi:hypothetical protein
VTDAFGHSDYARAAADILVGEETPLTLGLFGPWGLGKTWIVEQIGRSIGDRAAFAYFDVWRYEGDALRRQFLRSLAAQLHPAEANFDPATELKDLDEGRTEKAERLTGFRSEAFLETALRCAIAGIVAFLLLRVVGSSSFHDKHGTVRDIVISVFLTLLLFALTPLTQVFRVTEVTVTKSRLEDPEHFTERFATLLTRLKKNRLVIAIDNLDRCSPQRVEELLATIKTYLEPLGQSKRPWLLARIFRREPISKEAVFVIAADDEALRRHLEAKEKAASGGRTDKEIAQYVDEYLRKFFSTTLRIRPILDDDIRVYTDAELAEFSSVNQLKDVTRVALVEMVAAALAGTPRRIKQFGNNLDARLRVIRERELSGRIDPPISSNVLMIAKLAILEEEWPKSFRSLQDNPRAIDDWQRSIVEGSSFEFPEDDDAFRRFISVSRDIRADNLGAFISLKQSEDELRLPQFADFRVALVQGDAEKLREIVDSNPEQATEYARRVPGVLEEELRNRYLDGARAVVEAVCGVESLAAEQGVVRDVLRRAAGDPNLRKSLRTARAEPLFVASRLLAEGDRALILEPFLDLAGFLAEGSNSLADVISAFASMSDALPVTTRRALKSALDVSEISEHFETITPLAARDANLVPTSVARAAVEDFAGASVARSPSFQLLTYWLGGVSGMDDLDSLFLRSVGTLVASQQATLRTEGNAETSADLLGELDLGLQRLTSASPEAVQEFVAAVNVALSNWEPQLHSRVIEVVGAVTRLSPPVGAETIERLVTEYFAMSPDQAIEWVSDAGQALAPTLRGIVLQQLSLQVYANKDLRDKALDAIALLDPAGDTGTFVDTLQQALQRNLFLTTRTAVTRYPALVGGRTNALIDTALDQVEATSSSDALGRGIQFLTSVADDLSADQRNRLRTRLADGLESDDESIVAEVAESLEKLDSGSFQAELKELTKVAFGRLRQGGTPLLPIVRLVAAHLELLETSERNAFVTVLASLIGDPEAGAEAIAAANTLPALPPRQREQLVQALVDAEVLEPDIDKRADLLRAATRVAQSRGNARKIVDDRLDELAGAEGDDGEVFERLSRHSSSESEDEPAAETEETPKAS